MIIGWVFAILIPIFDLAFYEYISLGPLFFLILSLNDSEKRDIRIQTAQIVLFSFLYQAALRANINFLWLALVVLVVLFEVYRDYFFYSLIPSYIQSMIFLVPIRIEDYKTLIYGTIVSTICYIIIAKNMDNI